jgi:hypothetical protein
MEDNMSKSTYPTKYQLEHLKKRINNEIDPLINQAQLSVKSIIADLTEDAELKLAKQIKADVVIKELEDAIANLEIKQRKAQTFFGKVANKELKENLDYKFKDKNHAIYSNRGYGGGGLGIQPDDCREQLRMWAQSARKGGLKDIKLYSSKSIQALIHDPRAVNPLAVNDFEKIQKILINN